MLKYEIVIREDGYYLDAEDVEILESSLRTVLNNAFFKADYDLTKVQDDVTKV